jgi:hypothetical protein
LRLNGEERVLGFLKNEFILARSVSAAVSAATGRVRRALAARLTVDRDEALNTTLRLDSVERSGALLRVFLRQGFIFFDPAEDADDDEGERPCT